MTLIRQTEVEANLEVKAKEEPNHQVLSTTANTVANCTAGEIVLHMVKSARSAEKKITSKSVCKSGNGNNTRDSRDHSKTKREERKKEISRSE